MSQLYQLYQSVDKDTFTQMVCGQAPYFSTIAPRFELLEPGRAQVNVPFRKEITNHLGTVHAIALCNAAELVAGTMTDVSIPAGARWIPKGMTVEYRAKAKTDVVAVADGSQVDWSQEGDLVVPVSIADSDGTEVFTAAITMNVRHG
ncbi:MULTISPECIES: hotdog fold domain-containing protein [Alloalcanivorax]|uniref:Phenylacetic acid degradation-like protein n=1 Tax=Alloalcanivorax balearicus MACL04 TaxID=1177182 RepID=A0ABT2QUA5_9GAMM|nr:MULTISPECIES: hotdog fold domain-containing protein [Alloalcanivorax]MCE7524252.1 DUF4442 domain-containing protein [Alloalcanivorax xenomutans]MCU5781119.1 phenylacetic acid degradation-like protein [Alloalcanivorax balearicus MACL04]